MRTFSFSGCSQSEEMFILISVPRQGCMNLERLGPDNSLLLRGCPGRCRMSLVTILQTPGAQPPSLTHDHERCLHTLPNVPLSPRGERGNTTHHSC